MDERGSRGGTAAGILCLAGLFYIRGGLYETGRDAWLCAPAAAVLVSSAAVWLGARLRRGTGDPLALPALPRWAARAVTAAALAAAAAFAVREADAFTQFLSSNILADTPPLFTAAALLFSAALPVRAGRRALGSWCRLVFVLAAIPALTLLVFSASRFDLSHLRPVLASPQGFLIGTLRLAAAWLGMLVLLTPLFSGDTRLFPMLPAILAAGGFMSALFAANTLVLSAPVTGTIRYITYYAASVIGIGDFFQHVEILSAFVFQCAALVRLSVVLRFLCLCLKSLLSLSDARRAAAPAAAGVFFLYSLMLLLRRV